MKPIRILYLEDNEMDVELVESRLEVENVPFKLTHVRTPDQFRKALQEGPYDLVLLDYSVPGFGELAALKQAKAGLPDIPVIIVSGTIGEEIAIETLRMGAVDYILKQRISRLAPAINRAIQEAEERRKRKSAEDQIRKDLEEKEILLREIHHRVKNNLQVIISLLNMQLRRMKKQGVEDACLSCKNRIFTMALVHEKLYLSENLSEIHFLEPAESLVHELAKTYDVSRRIACEWQIEDFPLPVHISVPLALILNELVSNAFKFAFPENSKGTVRIALSRQKSGNCTFIIQDDGIGMPPSVKLESTETLGMNLIRILTEQIRGSVKIIRKNGTTVQIHFPLQTEHAAGK